MTQFDKVLNALMNGEALTAKQISSRFSVGNPYAVIQDIRFAGFPVYLNEKKNSKGTVVRRYRLGKASRKIVAAGYKAIAAGLA